MVAGERRLCGAAFKAKVALAAAKGDRTTAAPGRAGRLRMPQTRSYRDENGPPFHPNSLERAVRSERATKLAVAEMYVQGISNRKVTAIFQALRGLDITPTQVSRAATELDEQLSPRWNRPIGEITYLILDARYEKSSTAGRPCPAPSSCQSASAPTANGSSSAAAFSRPRRNRTGGSSCRASNSPACTA
jgi:hypothetical protein